MTKFSRIGGSLEAGRSIVNFIATTWLTTVLRAESLKIDRL
jgi:hypothetical protein